MKLNKYIYEKLNEVANIAEWSDISEEEVEEWIVDWYNDTFKELKEGAKEAPRGPPMWLAGPRWYDRRAKKIKEAALIEEAAARSYELDEV